MYPLTWRAFTWNWWDDNENGEPDVPGTDRYEEAYGDTPLAMISTAYLDSIDPDVKVPYVDEITLGIEHELVKDLRVSVRYINKARKRIMGSVLWDKDSDRYWYTQDLAPEWWVPFTTTVPATGSYPAQEVTMYFLSNDAPEQFRRLTNVPEAKLKYDSLEIGFDKRLAKGWQLGGSVNYTKLKGNYSLGYASWASQDNFSTPNSFVNAYGEMGYSRPIVIKLYGTFNMPYGFLFSFFYTHYDGSPWGQTVTVRPPADWADGQQRQHDGLFDLCQPARDLPERGFRQSRPEDRQGLQARSRNARRLREHLQPPRRVYADGRQEPRRDLAARRREHDGRDLYRRVHRAPRLRRIPSIPALAVLQVLNVVK